MIGLWRQVSYDALSHKRILLGYEEGIRPRPSIILEIQLFWANSIAALGKAVYARKMHKKESWSQVMRI